MKTGPIGIFDSGFGGLTIFKGIRRLLPEHDYVYLGDNARTPYGNRSFETVLRFTLEGVAHLFGLGCPLVVIACNTASAKALRSIQQQYLPATHPDRRVLGVIRPTVEAVDAHSATGAVALWATQGTVQSGSFAIELRKHAPRVSLTQQACPLLVPLIEAGELEGPGLDLLHRQVLGSDPTAGRRRRHAAARVHALPADPAAASRRCCRPGCGCSPRTTWSPRGWRTTCAATRRWTPDSPEPAAVAT